MAFCFIAGDAFDVLRRLPDGMAQCCVTSPPYWGLRSYGMDGQYGLESTPDAYVEQMVAVFREVRRVLRDDGTLWLNVGDSYASSGRSSRKESPGVGAKQEMDAPGRALQWQAGGGHNFSWFIPLADGSRVKPKDLVGIPWLLAFALRADGWYLRQDIIWAKPNPMPESVKDRPTRSHEYIFLLSKSAKYHYDAAAIREPMAESSQRRLAQPTFDQQAGGPKDYGPESNRSARKTLENLRDKQRGHARRDAGLNDRWDALTKEEQQAAGANKRDVWTVATRPYHGAHFATFPPALIEPCILAGSRPDSLVLDPFAGAGTTALVCDRLGRDSLGIELNPEYITLARTRLLEDRARRQAEASRLKRHSQRKPIPDPAGQTLLWPAPA